MRKSGTVSPASPVLTPPTSPAAGTANEFFAQIEGLGEVVIIEEDGCCGPLVGVAAAGGSGEVVVIIGGPRDGVVVKVVTLFSIVSFLYY